MHQLGMQLSAHLRAGDLILINGPLGAGKTVLTQGIGKGLGISDITSPTFVISRVHKAALPIIHVDAYRLLDTANPSLYLDDLDLDIKNSVTVIEWGGAESAGLSEDRLEILIDRSEDVRRVDITCVGKRWAGFTL
ncbi:MAG: tRNA (adenosine(37)-N6)-threonylcarbamoyltransferase complex ATPase subunit type 1 TsaE [Actinobacteria bacterium]|nr:tRNA (adenosine(37)-N6)-threonylcarbamoyltransferase complex ATPase subunit type 1 TsaE [Actinomycetota bacterium]MSX58012.1 tRNA (adenosine(37)-N6)-threonylcarbamoyltransferase complex ATPase subunit type 1 TsaE [Actinomycetota bacterium]